MLIGGQFTGYYTPLEEIEINTGVLNILGKKSKPKWTLYPRIPKFKASARCSSEIIFKKNRKRLEISYSD